MVYPEEILDLGQATTTLPHTNARDQTQAAMLEARVLP